MIADAALLLLVATVGIIWRMHETSEVPALIAFQALAFYSVARMLDHPISGSVTLGFALAAAFLTRGWIGFLPIMLARSEEHTSELQSLMRISYAVFCLKQKT